MQVHWIISECISEWMGREYMILRLINGSQSLPMEWFSYLFMSKCVILFCNHSISVSTRARSTFKPFIIKMTSWWIHVWQWLHNGGQFQPWNRLQHSKNMIRRVMKIKIITEVTYCGFTLYCMFKAFSLCLPMTFHSLPGTDSEVGGMLQHTTILASYIVFYKIDIRVLMNP